MEKLKVRPDVRLGQVADEGERDSILDSSMELLMEMYGMVGGQFNPPPWMNNKDVATFALNQMIQRMEDIAKLNGIELLIHRIKEPKT